MHHIRVGRTVAAAVTAFVVACLASRAQAGVDEGAIRDLRAQYNRTIEHRDVEGFARFLSPTFSELVSTGEVTRGAKAVAESYGAVEFNDPTFIAYDRRPDMIEVSTDHQTAVERGHWMARSRRSGHEVVRACGAYQAGWVRTDGAWRIQTEAYVALKCKISATP